MHVYPPRRYILITSKCIQTIRSNIKISPHNFFTHSMAVMIGIISMRPSLEPCNVTNYNILHFLEVTISVHNKTTKNCLGCISAVSLPSKSALPAEKQRDRRRSSHGEERDGRKEGTRTGSRFIWSCLELLEQPSGKQLIRWLQPRSKIYFLDHIVR